MARLNYKKIAPTGFNALLNVSEYVAHSGLEESLLHLLYLRVSQINGCPYCIDLHFRDAVKAGSDHRKLNALLIWRDMPFFSESERAVLAWAEAVTMVKDQSVMEESFHQLSLHFNEKEVVDLTFAIAQMNAFNRIAIAFHATPSV